MSVTDGAHILIVEDEEHLASGIRYNLQAEGYRVTVAGDGPAALEFLRSRDLVHLVVLDLMLPGMSGYAVCETARAEGYELPILILSARTLAEDRTRGFDVGADQYMTKPFDLDEFLSRVKNLLGRAARRSTVETPESAEFGEVQVDFATFEVTVSGEPAHLTQLEMKLLAHFIAHARRVIPRDELLREVWDLPGNLNTRAPDQFVHRLRKIFEPDPSTPQYFLTIRDAGYRFVPEGKTD